MATQPYPLAVPEDLLKEVRRVAKTTGLSLADVMRQSMKIGLPTLDQRLSRSGRVTNVDPLPNHVLAKLYAEREEDEEGIKRLMAAQPTGIEE